MSESNTKIVSDSVAELVTLRRLVREARAELAVASARINGLDLDAQLSNEVFREINETLNAIERLRRTDLL